MTGRPRVAVFRPDDERLENAVELLESLGVEPVADPMLAVEPTAARPRSDADVVILTSKTGADCLPSDWTAGAATLCAIGEPTAAALEEAGWSVDLVPETYSSRGLVEALSNRVDGRRVEIARSDHGSPVLTDGLDDAGAYHHETVLYRLVRPRSAGRSVEAAAARELAAALFTSSLTVEHFLEAAGGQGRRAEAIAGLDAAVVGAIGDPTARTAETNGLSVDVIPDTASFEALARTAVRRLEE
ncbi:MAG: uroporphyrinogen-III synthase [Halobacteriales archaeon]